MTKTHGLQLKGDVRNWSHYKEMDFDDDGVISFEEVDRSTNYELAMLLDTDCYYFEVASSGAGDFFVNFPAYRIASMFTDPQIRWNLHEYPEFQPFWHELGKHPEKLAAVIDEILTHESAEKGPQFADDLLLRTRHSSNWGKFFATLKQKHPAYVMERTELDFTPYTGLPANIDTNNDYRLKPNEIEAWLQNAATEEDTRDSLELGAFLLAANSLPKEELKTKYLIAELSPLGRGAIFMTMAILAMKDLQDASRFSEFLHEQVLFDPEGFLKSVKAIAEKDPVGSRIFLEYFDDTLSEEDHKILRACKEKLFPENPENLKGPYGIEGVLAVTKDNFELEVRQSTKPVLMVLGATWCANCRVNKPKVKAIADKYKWKIKTVTVDVNQEIELTGRFRLTDLPTFIIIQDGIEKDRLIDFSDEELENLLKEALKQEMLK